MKRIISIALVVMMVLALTVSVAAATSDVDSPVKDEYYLMSAEAVGAGKASVTPDKIKVGSDGTATFTATEDGGKFVKWEFHCEYEVVSGNVAADGTSTDKVVVLKPKSDIHGIAYFEGGEKPGKKDDSSSSPKTGYPLFAVFAIMGLAACTGVFAAKKIKG